MPHDFVFVAASKIEIVADAAIEVEGSVMLFARRVDGMMCGQHRLGCLRGWNIPQQDNQTWFHRMAMHSLPSPMDSGARAFGQSAEGVLDQRQTRHPNSYYCENDGNWVGR